MSKYSHPNKTRRTHLNLQDIFARCKRDADGCIIWQGSLNSDGYGSMTIDQKGYKVHRWVAFLVYGPRPSKVVVMHSCDKPSCVNPDHLRFGSQQDNIADMVAKGRGFVPVNKGDTHSQAILNSAKVLEIRDLLENTDLFQWQIAERYGVKQVTISDIKRGRRWGHV